MLTFTTAASNHQALPEAAQPVEPPIGADAGKRQGWRKAMVENVLPLLSSLAVHAGVLIVGVLAAKVIMTVPDAQEAEAQIGVAETSGLKTGLELGVMHVGQTQNPFTSTAQDKDPTAPDIGGINSVHGMSKALTAAGGGSGDGDPSDLIGGGPGSSGKSIGIGIGNGLGAGTGDGPMARFGALNTGGILGAKGAMFAPAPEARQLAFVCDASGSMVSKMASLKDELAKAVDRLKPFQSFNVIFFGETRSATLSDGGLLMASSDHKRKAYQFLNDVTPSGTTNAIPGLELAFRQKPQLVYLLTDGDFPDNDAVIAKINELNAQKKVRINTIAFVSDGNSGTELRFAEVLEQIAKDNGGKFSLVRESDLNQ